MAPAFQIGRALLASALTAVLLAGVGAAPAAAAVELVLCDGEVYDGYDKTPFVLDGGVAADAGTRKVIRNCTFRDARKPGVRIVNARNVVIEGSRFENIRTHEPGVGVTAIAITGGRATDGIVVRNSVFRSIGADGIQIGDAGRATSNVLIEDNSFFGSEAVGENGIDVKGTNGPVVIRGNLVQGFRECQSPKRGGSQDCSGSPGVGVVVHAGSHSGRANDVTVEANRLVDNGPRAGLVVSDADNVRVIGNVFDENFGHSLLVTSGAGRCWVGLNTLLSGGPLELGDCLLVL